MAVDSPRRARPLRPPARAALSFALAAIVLCIGSDGVRGYSWFTFGGSVVVWPSPTDTRWLSEATFPEGSDIDTAVLGAIGAWNITGGSSWTYSAGRGELFPPDQIDGISFTAAVPASYLDDSSILAVTLLGNAGAEWVDMDTLFNANAPNDWLWTTDTAPACGVMANPETNGFVFMSVALHEFGHAFGLGHEDRVLATLNTLYPDGGTFGQENVIEPHADDRAGQRFLYPGGSFTDLANANFHQADDGSAARNTFEPTTVDPGGALSIRIHVENLGTTTVENVRQGFYLSQDDTIDTSDTLIATITWSMMEAAAAGTFDVLVDLPADVPSGTYHVGSILDDTGDVVEAWEDNNATRYCQTLTVNLLAPRITDVADQVAACGRAYTGTQPALAQPPNMEPVTWSLEQGPDGMTIDPASGIVSWQNPVVAGSPHTVTIRATNSVGSDQTTFLLFVPRGDLDGDGRIDLVDFALIDGCIAPSGGGTGSACTCADLNMDARVDLIDYGAFQVLFGQRFP